MKLSERRSGLIAGARNDAAEVSTRLERCIITEL